MILAPLCRLVDAQQPADKVFTAPDGSFRFVYPSDFQVCTRDKTEPCTHSFIPACEEDPVVCVDYPAKEFKDTNFEAAAFQIREIFHEEQMTPDVCVTPYPHKEVTGPSSWPDFLVSAEHPIEMIGGVQFLHGVSGGAATGHSISTDLYRAFHKGRCFELGVNQSATNPNMSDPPMKTITPAQQKKLQDTMSYILHSFRFSN